MFACTSFRVGAATLNSKITRQANFQKTTAIFSAWAKINTHGPKKPTNDATSFGGSASKAIATGGAALLLIAGLDCVAPSSYPYEDQAAGTNAQTYWNSVTPNNENTTSSSANRSPLLPKNTTTTTSTTNHQYKVCIVGGGMAGLHTALALAEQTQTKNNNDNIILLDSHRIGQSASGRSKGLVVPGIQVEQEGLARICQSESMAEQIFQLTLQAAHRLQYEIVQKYQISCDWVTTGHVEATLHDHHEDDDEEDDGTCRELTAEQVRQVLGQPEHSTLYKGGELDITCSGVDPLKLTLGLAKVLEDKFHVRIAEQTHVTKIETIQQTQQNDNSSAMYTVTTSTGAKIDCNHVVLCTGPERLSPQLSQRLKHAIIPIYTWMAATEPLGDQCPLRPLPDDNNDNNNEAPMCGDDFVCLNYWRRTPDGRLLFGSLADAYPSPKWWAEHRLRRALTQIYPQLSNVKFEQVWGGRIAFPRNAVPLIGRDEGWDHGDVTKGGVWYATGFGGHGIVPTVMAGSILAKAISGQDDETWRLFHDTFAPRHTFYPFSQLGAQALLSVYNAFDWLHVKGVPVPQLPKPW